MSAFENLKLLNNINMTELPPATIHKDKQTGAEVWAQHLPDDSQFATFPAGKFWNSNNTAETGLWIESEFLARFSPAPF